jgi:hypothetical protein
MPRQIEFTMPALTMLHSITDQRGVEYGQVVAKIARDSARTLGYQTVTVVHLQLVYVMVKELRGG